MRAGSRVALGTFPFANVFTQIGGGEARAIVGRFIDAGGYYLDTAQTYGLGQVESLLGRILRDFRRDQFFIASKGAYVWDESSPPRIAATYHNVIAACENSLRRLQLDELDLYILHEPDPGTPPDETMAALVDLRAQGKIRQIGVSNVTLAELKAYNAGGDVAYVQNRFSLLNRSFSPEFVDYCTGLGIGLTPYQVIERGLLTDHAARGIALREGDLRHTKPEFKSQIAQVIGAWVAECLQPIAESQRTSVAALAIWWSLQQPGIAFAICGATSQAQVAGLFQGASLDPEPGTLDRIEACYDILRERLLREHSAGVREFMGLA